MLTLTAGSEYLTRSGLRAVIYATDRGGDRPVHGAVWVAEKAEWSPTTWRANGRYASGDGVNSEWDIISARISVTVSQAALGAGLRAFAASQAVPDRTDIQHIQAGIAAAIEIYVAEQA